MTVGQKLRATFFAALTAGTLGLMAYDQCQTEPEVAQQDNNTQQVDAQQESADNNGPVISGIYNAQQETSFNWAKGVTYGLFTGFGVAGFFDAVRRKNPAGPSNDLS